MYINNIHIEDYHRSPVKRRKLALKSKILTIHIARRYPFRQPAARLAAFRRLPAKLRPGMLLRANAEKTLSDSNLVSSGFIIFHVISFERSNVAYLMKIYIKIIMKWIGSPVQKKERRNQT